MRMMVARALLPMGPADLFASLAFMITNESGELADTARKSLEDMPGNVIQGVIADIHEPSLLDFALHEYVEDHDLALNVLLNTATSEEAVEWAARRCNGRLVEVIGNNQERLVRHPSLVEAIYYNPEAPMAVGTRVFETGVRSGLDLHHIPGFKEIYTSIFGDQAGQELADAEREELGGAAATAEAAAAVIASLPDDLPPPAEDDGVEEDDFMQALREASVQEDEDAAAGAAEDEGKENQPIHALIKTMSVSQKIRMALVGNKTARALLIKDPKPIVALAVLKSPQISPKEVVDFTKNKALSDRVMGQIARNQKWCKDKAVRTGLIKHPKAPAGVVNRWVRTLPERELKSLSKSREVPQHVARLAKNILDMRAKSKK